MKMSILKDFKSLTFRHLNDFRDFFMKLLFLFLSHLELSLKKYLKSLKAKIVSHKKKKMPQKASFRRMTYSILYYLIKFPVLILYYVYIMPPLFITQVIFLYFSMILKIVYRRSHYLRSTLKKLKRDLEVFVVLYNILKHSKIFELVFLCYKTSLEIFNFFFWPSNIISERSNIFFDDSSDVLLYEEIDSETDLVEIPDSYRKSLGSMHNFIPVNPFKATVLINRPSSDLIQEFNRSHKFISDREAEPVSPTSFPATPFSRAYVMNASSEKVVSLMFAARDKLRLEAQSVSRDEYSRLAAKEAKTTGQFAVFDPEQASTGIALTCGNHCAVKVGQGLCCCCRSMLPIRTRTYVYFEFSITVSNAFSPTLGIGLAPPDSPLNVMVGSWPKSIGIYSDGQILIGSHWFSSSPYHKIEAGSTIGISCYLPEESESETEFEQELSLLKFSVDGKLIKYPKESEVHMKMVLQSGALMFPTVSLFSEETRVWCRFCEADIVYRSRQSIGVPENARVYCLDGSLLLEEYD